MHYPLLTPRLRIRPIDEADLDAFVAYRRVAEVARFQSWETTYAFEQALELARSQVGVVFPASCDWLQLGIHLLDSDELIGDVALHNVAGTTKVIELGFTLAPEHQGRGYGLEAVNGVITAVRDGNSATKFVAHTDTRNTPSIKLLQGVGLEEHPELSWIEEFKGETVKVLRFESP